MVDGDRWVYEISICVQVPRTNLGDLSGATGHQILMAVSADGGIVDGTEPAVVSFPGFEICLIERERIVGRLWNAVADTL